MEENPTIKWWNEQAAGEFKQAVFSELYGFHLFVEEALSWELNYYRFGRDETGDAVWLLQRDSRRQEYEIMRVEEAQKLSQSQPVWPTICHFWGDTSDDTPIDVGSLSRATSINAIKKLIIKAGKDLARRINRHFVGVLLEASRDSRISAKSVKLSDLLAAASDNLASRRFSVDRFVFPSGLQNRLIQQGIITKDDWIKSDHYVGRTRTGLRAFWSTELPDDTALVFDSTANLVITKEGRFETHKMNNDPFFVGVGGVVHLNPIVKNVLSVIALQDIEEALDREGKNDEFKVKQAKEEIIFVDLARIEELRAISSSPFDLVKLIKLCEELNVCYANDCFLAVPMLVRAILDHIPPILGFRTFAEVANNYPGKSFKQSMQRLEVSSRSIADAHLHQPIRSKESLPSRVQVNFSNDLDVLLAEIVRVLR